MKILVTGKGTSGSWQIRGVQLGAAIGADVQAGYPKVNGCDLAVLVKRPTPQLLERLRGKPVVWDVVDAWPQPGGNERDRPQAMQWLGEQLKLIKPIAVVATTRAMEADLQEFGLPTITLPHHARPNQELNPIRESIRRVGYEGSERYLGHWQQVLQAQCRKRGWQFVLHPPVLADLDVVVGLRDVHGYPIRRWKSNVKLANAQGTGTPCVMSPEQGYLENQSGAEFWAEDERGLSSALDALEGYQERATTSRILLSAAPHLDMIAARYKQWLTDLPLKS